MTLHLVGIAMGSESDYPVMVEAENVLNELGIKSDVRVVSVHRTPERLYDFARGAASSSLEVIIAGAGGAAHLPGMIAAMTHLPVLGVPVNSESNNVNDLTALLSIAQMPGGIPVATFAVGKAGAKNAGLFAAAILGLKYDVIQQMLISWRHTQTTSVVERPKLKQEEKK